ncbi:MAG: hypothetical protein KF914_01690 [Rhizobiaceae bacterium]|nr:hypothetical protein [Rhizobiaceae bacterium]
MWIKALTQDFLALELNVAPGIRARIVERPGIWMSETEAAALVADIRAVAERTVPGEPLDYGVMTGSRERLSNSILTILYERDSGRPVAFNALAVMDVTLHGTGTTVVHLGLVMVDPGVRSKGFSWVLYGLTCIILFARQQLRPLWLSNVTQVPAIVGMVSESFADVFPRPDPAARRSFEHLVLAREIMSRHRHVFGVGGEAGFDEDRFVITNAYTGGSDNLKKTFDQAPKSRDEIYNEFCRRELDYGRGDDVLQLGRLDLAAAQRFVLKDVPRRSLPAVAATLAVVSLNRLFLPLLYWLSADRQWGILRPARKETAPPA